MVRLDSLDMIYHLLAMHPKGIEPTCKEIQPILPKTDLELAKLTLKKRSQDKSEGTVGFLVYDLLSVSNTSQRPRSNM